MWNFNWSLEYKRIVSTSPTNEVSPEKMITYINNYVYILKAHKHLQYNQYQICSILLLLLLLLLLITKITEYYYNFELIKRIIWTAYDVSILRIHFV
jgi:hypothetical protein